MKQSQLQSALIQKIPLVWNDPAPIEGNDYTINSLNGMPNAILPEDEWKDCILLIQYGEGSEAEILPHEIDFKTIITDPDCNQTCKQIDVNVFEFEENRVVNPETKETERFSATIDLSEYSHEEMFESVKPFGYSFNEMSTWIDEGENLALIAECIFEML